MKIDDGDWWSLLSILLEGWLLRLVANNVLTDRNTQLLLSLVKAMVQVLDLPCLRRLQLMWIRPSSSFVTPLSGSNNGRWMSQYIDCGATLATKHRQWASNLNAILSFVVRDLIISFWVGLELPGIFPSLEPPLFSGLNERFIIMVGDGWSEDCPTHYISECHNGLFRIAMRCDLQRFQYFEDDLPNFLVG